MEMELKEFGKWVRELRISAGYDSQRDLAKASGVHNSSIAEIERGIRRPSTSTLLKLAPCLRVSYTRLHEAAGYPVIGIKDGTVETMDIPDKVLDDIQQYLFEVKAKMDHVNLMIERYRAINKL
jgi:transcriptional regulator with XRE-family HTH domain